MKSRASDAPLERILLVTLVPRLTVKLAVGTCPPARVVMVPPVHWMMISPICSVKPSDRSTGGTDTCAPHVRAPPVEPPPPLICAPASPTNRANKDIARTTLRKLTISFSLCIAKLNRSKFSSQPEPLCEPENRSSNLGNFSVSGGEHISRRPPSWPSGLTEGTSRGACLLFFVFCAHRERTKNCTRKPDAVKIFITDCPPCVKRNSFPSARNGAPAGRFLSQASSPI